MEAVVLAGGLGTRLSTRLIDRPKPMALIAGRPFLEILLNQLVTAGCRRAILSVGHLRQVIMEAFGAEHRGMAIDYAIEESPLGTGGAIRMALQMVAEPAALILNGDTYLDVDYSALMAAHSAARTVMTMAITHVNDVGRYGGVVLSKGRISEFTEKGQSGPGWINAGVYALNRDFPWSNHLPIRFSFEKDLLFPDLRRLHPSAFPCDGYFLDIGVPEDLDRAQVELARIAL
jgi:D-glycero-alpha-D-manno-heptose 1-phosphate guanylyltransferase